MDGVTLVGQIVDILVAGIVDLGAGIGSGISSFATSLAFVTPEGGTTTLSVFFIVLLAFAGVSLAVGITTRIFLWLSSLGNN